MKGKVAILLLFLQAFMQGVAFTTFPSASNLLTSAEGFSFNASQYGKLFVPMVIGTILSSFLASTIAKRRGIKAVLLFASCANAFSMLVFSASDWAIGNPALSYPLLLLCMLFLGLGFGTNMMVLSPYVLHFFLKKPSNALTALYTSLGLGAAIGPLLFAFFSYYKEWWIDPLFIAICNVLLFLLSISYLPSHLITTEVLSTEKKQYFRKGLLLFVFVAFLYGMTETAFGNWIPLFLHLEKGFSAIEANVALSLFWASITLGRLGIVALSYKISSWVLYRFLFLVILLSLLLVHYIHTPLAAMISFIIAGIGCSGFLPFTFSFAERRFPSSASFILGLLISCYMAGFGASSQGIGFLHEDKQVSFLALYLWLIIPVALLAYFCYFVTKKK